MVTTSKTALKDINLDLLVDELIALSVPGNLELLGFDQLSARIYTPAASTKVVERATGQADITAEPGKLALHSPSDLTAQQDSDLDAALIAHDETAITTAQRSQDKQDTDLNTFKVLWDKLEARPRDGSALTAAEQDEYRWLQGKILLRDLHGDRII